MYLVFFSICLFLYNPVARIKPSSEPMPVHDLSYKLNLFRLLPVTAQAASSACSGCFPLAAPVASFPGSGCFPFLFRRFPLAFQMILAVQVIPLICSG
jgi:hypothetical protein